MNSALALTHEDVAAEPWLEQSLSWLGGLFDRVMLGGMRMALENAILPTEDDLPAIRASALPYLDAELQRNPRAFFAFLDRPLPDPEMAVRAERALPGGVAITRHFRTRYEPYSCEGVLSCAENDTVAIEHWMHTPGPARATVIALHGFTMGQPRIDAHVLMAARWFALGLDVALVTLPFHGCRSPRTASYSGEMFASWHVGRLNESVRQAVHDLHLVRSWLADLTGSPVGLLGLSLGGYLAALFAGLCPDLAFVVPVVPPVWLWDLPMRLFGRGDTLPVPVAELQAAYRVHSPLSHPLAIPAERALVIGGRGDQIVPLAHAQALWRHWDEPSSYWFSGSHSAPFRRARIMARVAEHLFGLGLLPQRA